MRLDCALSCFDSYALERRLGSGLLLRHPQVSNQNSKRADSIRREEEPGKIYQYPYPFPFPAAPHPPLPFWSISTIKFNPAIHWQPIRSTRQFCAPTGPPFCAMTGTKAETVFCSSNHIIIKPKEPRELDPICPKPLFCFFYIHTVLTSKPQGDYGWLRFWIASGCLIIRHF